MDELNDFIKIYENALEANICDFLISLFDQTEDKQERYDNDGKPNYNQFNLTKNKDISNEVNQIHNYIIKKIFNYKNVYYDYVNKNVFPEEHALEHFNIVKYEPNGIDKFDTHVDVENYSSARRFLSFMWYLNDVSEGGKTVFKDLEIQPKKGTLVIFPSFWLFPHREESPVSNPKYILTAYLHYK